MRVHDDLPGHARLGRAAVDALEHRALDLGPVDRRLDEHLAVVPAGLLDRRLKLVGPEARDVPIDDPPRAGLTNTGQPSSPISSSTRLRSAVDAAEPQSRSRTTTYGPMGSPRAANSSFMYSLSMPAALASTPAPAYLTPAISSSPWIVPSSPKVPCSSGSTTSTSPRSARHDGGPAEHERAAAWTRCRPA